MKKFTMIALLAMMSLNANADRVGNGGDVVVCRNATNQITSIEALDIYEGRVRWRIEFDLGDSSLSPLEKVELALSRLDRVSPIRAQRYLEKAQQFEANALFLDNVELLDIPDSNHLVFPKNCKVEQIIVQRTPRFPDDRRYHVSNDLWKLLDSTNKAALILHEIIYEEALEFWHQDSVPTRYFNANLMSHRFTHLTPKETANFFRTIDFKTFDYQGFVYSFSKTECPHQFLNERAEEKWPIQFFDDGITAKSGCVLSGSVLLQGKEVNVGGFISFHDNGQPHSFVPRVPDPYEPLTVQINGKDYAIPEFHGEYIGEIQLHRDGSLKGARLANENELVFESSNYAITVERSSRDFAYVDVTLYSNGVISNIKQSGEYPDRIRGWAITRGQRQKIYVNSDSVYFFPDGTLKEAEISRKTPLSFTIHGHQYEFSGRVELYETGELKSGRFHAERQESFLRRPYFEEKQILVPVGDQKIEFWLNDGVNGGRYIYFYPGYKIKQGLLSQSETFKNTDGRILTIARSWWVFLDEQGHLIKYEPQ